MFVGEGIAGSDYPRKEKGPISSAEEQARRGQACRAGSRRGGIVELERPRDTSPPLRASFYGAGRSCDQLSKGFAYDCHRRASGE